MRRVRRRRCSRPVKPRTCASTNAAAALHSTAHRSRAVMAMSFCSVISSKGIIENATLIAADGSPSSAAAKSFIAVEHVNPFERGDQVEALGVVERIRRQRPPPRQRRRVPRLNGHAGVVGLGSVESGLPLTSSDELPAGEGPPRRPGPVSTTSPPSCRSLCSGTLVDLDIFSLPRSRSTSAAGSAAPATCCCRRGRRSPSLPR